MNNFSHVRAVKVQEGINIFTVFQTKFTSFMNAFVGSQTSPLCRYVSDVDDFDFCMGDITFH